MEEFDEDDFSDLYADVEVQASSAISAMHELREIPHINDGVSRNVVNGFTQLPGDDRGIVRRGGNEENEFSETEIRVNIGGSYDNASEAEDIAEEEGKGGLTKIISEIGDTRKTESETESDNDLDIVTAGNEQKIVDNYDAHEVESELMSERQHRVKETEESEEKRAKEKRPSEKRLKARDYESKRKYVGSNSLASSSNLKSYSPAGALRVDNVRHGLMDKGPLVRLRASRCTPAHSHLSSDLDKRGSVQISDSEEDNNREVSDYDSDGMAEISDVTKKINASSISHKVQSVEPESSQSDGSQHCLVFSCSSSPSAAVSNDEREKNHKHSKKNPSNFISELPESVACDYHCSNKFKSLDVKSNARERRYYVKDRHPIRKELKQQMSHSNEKDASDGFDVKGVYDMPQTKISHVKSRSIFKQGLNEMNKPYCKGSKSSFTYFQGLFPYRHFGPAYLESHYWNIYPAFGRETSWYNGHNMNGGRFLIDKNGNKMDSRALHDNGYHNERRHAVEDRIPLKIKDSRKLIPRYSYLNRRGTQFNNKGHGMKFRRRTNGDDLSPLPEHYDDFMKGKDRGYGQSAHSDRDHLDHGHDRDMPRDRRGMKSPERRKRRRRSPLNSFESSWHMENEENERRYIKHQPLHIHPYAEPHVPGIERSQGVSGPKSSPPEGHLSSTWEESSRESGRYGSINAFDTSEGLRCHHGEDHLYRRRHYQQSTNTFSSTGSINNQRDHDHFDRRQHHQLSEIFLWNEKEPKSRYMDAKMFRSEGPSYQFERSSKDTRTDNRHVHDRVSDFPDVREADKHAYKIKREGISGNPFDQVSKFVDPDSHLPRQLRYQDSVNPHLLFGKKNILQSSERVTEAEDAVYHSRYDFEEWNDNQNFKDLNDFNPWKVFPASEGKVDAKRWDKKKHDKFCRNHMDEFLDIEEGQIITEEINEKAMEGMIACENVKQSNGVGHSEVAPNRTGDVERLDDQRIQEILAKMEKRRERFKEPIIVKNNHENISKHLPDLVVETAGGKTERPTRKRRWVGS